MTKANTTKLMWPALLLALALLAGCSGPRIGDENEPPSEPESGAMEAQAPEPSEETEDEESSSVVETRQPEPEPNPEPEPEPESEPEPVLQAASQGTIYASFDVSEISGFGLGNERRVGTQEELDEVRDFFAALRADSLNALAAQIGPTDFSKDYPLSDAELAELVALLQAPVPALLPEHALDNPYTGGGWTVYLDTPDGRMLCTYSGWFIVAYPDRDEQLVFEAESAEDAFQAISDYLWNKMNGIH